jgi:hypothetical protein
MSARPSRCNAQVRSGQVECKILRVEALLLEPFKHLSDAWQRSSDRTAH